MYQYHENRSPRRNRLYKVKFEDLLSKFEKPDKSPELLNWIQKLSSEIFLMRDFESYQIEALKRHNYLRSLHGVQEQFVILGK